MVSLQAPVLSQCLVSRGMHDNSDNGTMDWEAGLLRAKMALEKAFPAISKDLIAPSRQACARAEA